MTRDDIISAAFTVWGRDLYKTTSLSKLAKTLKVTKPALYRHFPDKTTLLEAMNARYYDDYAAWLKPVLEEALKPQSWQERLLFLVRSLTAYFARHFEYFIYTLIIIHRGGRGSFKEEEMEKRGAFFSKLSMDIPIDRHPPSVFLVSALTALFGTALFHKSRKNSGIVPSEEDVLSFACAAAGRVRRGLDFDRGAVDSLDYEKLESLGGAGRHDFPPGDPLLEAVARAVAEAGPWNASMETVARYSGLSKSGLYAHFKSKGDMLSRLFMSEFERIAAITAARSALGENRAEKLYLALLSIADYLKSRTEILIVLDWVRIQRLELDISVPPMLLDFFSGLDLDATIFEGSPVKLSQWILFLLVTTLMHAVCGSGNTKISDMDDKSFRKLFRFITLGVEGWA
jgi:AcrR family transcriptional regulator